MTIAAPLLLSSSSSSLDPGGYSSKKGGWRDAEKAEHGLRKGFYIHARVFAFVDFEVGSSMPSTVNRQVKARTTFDGIARRD